jgi:prepilin-type N-terminal cleavage/methylation domain-containing protein
MSADSLRQNRRNVPARGPHGLRARQAFTLIEIVIVLVMIGIIAAFAFPRVNIVQWKADGAARMTRVALQTAQRLAITRQYDVICGFDLTNNRIRLVEDANSNGAVDAGERVTYRALEDGDVFAAPPAGVNGSALTAIVGSQLVTIDGMKSIIFRRDGASSSDLEVYITSPRAKHDDFRAVVVTQATGRSDWYKYINDTWKQGSL